MIIHNMEQGTDEWFEVRKGKLTASNGTAIATNGAGLKTYVKEVVLALFTTKKPLTGADFDRGNELEPIARMKYEFEKNVEVLEVGFIEISNRAGYSPDGLVGEEGLIEIKARNDAKHLDLLLTNKIDSGTVWQMQMGMLATNRKWCDFISYNPNFKKNSMYVKRVYRDELAIQKLRKGIYEGSKMIEELLIQPFIQEEIKLANNLQGK